MEKNIQHDPEYSIVVLCYGAGDSIPDFVESVTRMLLQNSIHDYQLVLVGNYLENKCIDQTARIVLELAKNDLRIISVVEKKDGMMGWDMRSGLAAATGKYISVIDGDGQMPIEDLVRVYQKIKNENYDLVKTVRSKRGDGLWRQFVSSVFNGLFRLLFPLVRAKDINSKPKVFTRDAYKRFDLRSDDWFIDSEIMIQASNLELKVGEVPTYFRASEREGGSFINLFTFLEFLKNLIRFKIIQYFSDRK